MNDEEVQIRIKKRKIRSLIYDSKQSAAAVNLVYVNDKQPGISRIRKGSGFIYKSGDKNVDKETLFRIDSLVIPPAWEQVWVCATADGHLQATGIDTRKRKQYIYHPLWKTLRSQTKFFHLYDFGKALPAIRQKVNTDMSLPGLPLNKVLATIVSLMAYTGIRVGNNEYEKIYGSFGLTTLKDKHVQIKGNDLSFSFKGKKGVFQNIKLKSKRLARIVKQCRDIPGKELFQYYDESGERHGIDSGMVNGYIKSLCDLNFTSKDFRTWAGTVYALEVFCGIGACDNITETKKRITDALDVVARRLGNTRSVCKKYYVHPIIINHFANGTIKSYIDKTGAANAAKTDDMLSLTEMTLMKMLEEAKEAVIAA
jgi:DNA topoisomerase I